MGDGTELLPQHPNPASVNSEMGTGIKTSLAQVLADELEVDWSRVRIVQADGDAAAYGSQNTDGSRSVRQFFTTMRRAGAVGRRLLEQAAAEVWGVALDSVRAENHRVLHAATVAIDRGTVVNRDRVRAQLEGGTIFGLSLARSGAITARDGRIVQSNFHDYPVLRCNEAPRTIHTDIIEADAPPAGVGEVATPPAAPALTNAIFAATGRRIRDLPLTQHDLSW